jgi:hypothetical protein
LDTVRYGRKNGGSADWFCTIDLFLVSFLHGKNTVRDVFWAVFVLPYLFAGRQAARRGRAVSSLAFLQKEANPVDQGLCSWLPVWFIFNAFFGSPQ